MLLIEKQVLVKLILIYASVYLEHIDYKILWLTFIFVNLTNQIQYGNKISYFVYSTGHLSIYF